MNAHELFHAGKLTEAVAAAIEGVRQNPTDKPRRLFLAELLCFTGDLERADNQLDAIPLDDPATNAWLSEFRQLVRAEQARIDFYASGRVPSFLDKPEGLIRQALEASVLIREGMKSDAAQLLDQVEEQRPRPGGVCDGQAFDDFRDLDDTVSCVLEVLTTKGDYYWIPVARIDSIEFTPPARPRDLLFRRTRLIVRGGPDGEVFVPVLYPGASGEADDAIRLGRFTDWRGGDGEPVRGVGQRTFLVGQEPKTILELQEITFNDPQAGAASEPAT